MDDRVRLVLRDEMQKPRIILGDVDHLETDGFPRNFLPTGEANGNRANRRQGFDFQLDIDLAARQIVNDRYLVSKIGKMQRSRPPAKPVAPDDEYFHLMLLPLSEPRSPKSFASWPNDRILAIFPFAAVECGRPGQVRRYCGDIEAMSATILKSAPAPPQ